MNPEPSSTDPLARLRRGREILAPESLWSRIESVARRDSEPVAWPVRLFALAAGALLWVGVNAAWAPCLEHELASPAWSHSMDAAAPFLVRGTIDDPRGDALATRPEVLLVQSLIVAPEDSR